MARCEKLQPQSVSRRLMIPQPARLGERLEDLGINYSGRRGRCLAEMDLMTIRPRFALSNGLAERLSARSIKALTAGLSKSDALSRTMWRTCLPPPFSSFYGDLGDGRLDGVTFSHRLGCEKLAGSPLIHLPRPRLQAIHGIPRRRRAVHVPR